MRPYFYAPNVTGGIAYFDDVSLKQITTASINNGGFEDWTTATNAAVWTESVAGTSTVNREDAAPYSGTNAARFDVDASNSLALINQVGIMSVGKLYTYTSYAKASDTVTLRIGDTSGSTNTHTLTTAYSQYSGSIRATSTYFGAYSLSASSNSIYLDSVTLTAAEILGTTGIPRGRGPTVDYAGQFNGTSQYLSYTGTAFNPGTGDFSVGASFYLDKTAANIILFSSGTPGDANDAFYINRDAVGRIQILLNDSSGASFSATTTGTTSVGRWYTVVVNFDRDGNCTVSLNGAAAENLGSISGKLLSIDPGNFFVGRYASTNTLHFPGRINGAFYANRLLTSNEITYLHNNGKWRQFTELGLPGTNGSSLTSSVIRGFWDMDTAGNLGLDSTTNANNLTNNGTVTQGTGNSQYTGGANFTFDQPGTLNLSSATVRVTDGTFDVDDAGTLTPGSSTLELNGISTLSGSTTQSLHNVKILTGAVVTQRSAVTMDGTFTSSGSYAISSGNLSVGESLYLPGTFTHGNATVTLTGAGSAAIDTGGNSLYALTLNGGGAYDLLDTLTVTSALTLAGSSVLDLNGSTLVVTGASFSNEGTLRLQGGETVTDLTNDSNSGTVEYDGTSGPYTLKDWTYYDLVLSGAGATVALGANATVSHTLTVNANATLSLGSSTLTATSATISNSGTMNEGTGKIAHTHSSLLLADASYAADDSFATDDTLYLTVTDADGNLSGTSTDTLSVTVAASTGDSEAVTLTETTNTSGIFRGSLLAAVQANTAAIVADNGYLEVPSDTPLTLTYTDAQDTADTGTDSATLTIVSSASSTTTSTTTTGGSAGGTRGSPEQMAGRIAQARETILARFEGIRQESQQIAVQEDTGAEEEQAAREREARIAERIAKHEAAIALAEKEQEELRKKYALHREERYAKALALQVEQLATSQAALKMEQEALKAEQKANEERRAERLAERSKLTKEQELALKEAEQREEQAAKEREARIAERITKHEADIAESEQAQEELQKQYALHREERFARALEEEQKRAAAAGSALAEAQKELAGEQEANVQRREERLAEREKQAQERLKSAARPLGSTSPEIIAARRDLLFATIDEQPVIFGDVPLSAWYAPYVSYVIEEKIATGYADDKGKLKGEFGVENPITYAEVLKMAMQASDQAFDLRGLTPPRNKSAQGMWSAAYVSKAESLQLSVFAPALDVNKPATRGAVIQTL
ncbi:MAG: LamG-like jellyroll fold domain-containing protein, partial [Candidatus Peribacter sp.]